MRAKSGQLVFRVKEYGRQSEKVVFLFCPFGVPSWQMALPGLPIWHLKRHGYRVVAYSYGLSIITQTPEVTMANLHAILADADKRIGSLVSVKKNYCFGTSMGTVLAVNFASRHANVTKVVLNLSYRNTADHIVHLPPMRTYSSKKLKRYIAAGNGETGLHNIFDPYSPDHLIAKLKGKCVLLYTSRNDRILKYSDTKDLKIEMERAGVSVEYVENQNGGHYFAALANHLKAQKYLRFLAK